MKTLRLILAALLAAISLTAAAQQNQALRRSSTVFLFPEFRDATIRQTFGRTLKAKANIFLKDASLCYMDNGKVMRAYTKSITGVDFDTLRFMKVDSAMARVVAQKGYNYLLCLTSVNLSRYYEETTGGSELPFFDMPDLNIFLQLDGEQREEDKGIPLQDKYYFNIQGRIIPANESSFKKVLADDQLKSFKALMANRFWSWADPESLMMLFDFLP